MGKNSFEDFGSHLKKIRVNAKETIADVSSAVEVDTVDLKKIEDGKKQPAEDIVLLLISHFALKEDEAMKMWELAGYAQNKTGNTSMLSDINGTTQTAYISQNDARILYTDMVHVNANRFGVVINFMQHLGANNQPMAVSRIGMSNEHAKSLIEVLQQTIDIAQKQNNQDIDKLK